MRKKPEPGSKARKARSYELEGVSQDFEGKTHSTDSFLNLEKVKGEMTYPMLRRHSSFMRDTSLEFLDYSTSNRREIKSISGDYIPQAGTDSSVVLSCVE
ncbi:MAG TPA: hypothetical protein VGO47_04135 [Chlamydiales bacterium]|nr:hypothetical protein [Chlamydiales bacterium]